MGKTEAGGFAQRGSGAPEISVVMPCLNEAETLGGCITQILNTFERAGLRGEVIVADNGSTDGSREIAEQLGARVVPVARKGYGSALMGGIEGARANRVVMADADGSYDFTDIPKFVAAFDAGADLVMGNRFLGGIKPGAMPPLHRYLGNPVLTGIGRLFFGSASGDFHCGLRGITVAAYERMGLRTTGMEFASEMVVKATLFKMQIAEVATTLSPAGRTRAPHLRSWRDGWRHLRFLLMYSPRWLFLYPGLLLMLAGTGAALWLLPGARVVRGVELDIHTLLYAMVMVLVGFQSVLFAMFTKVFAITTGLLPEDPRLNRVFRYFTLEAGLVAGLAMLATGLAFGFYSTFLWDRSGFGPMDPARLMRVVTVAVALILLGVQVTLSSLFFSILGMTRK